MDALLSLPIVGYFLMPGMASWSTSLNVLFFYMVCTHDSIEIRIKSDSFSDLEHPSPFSTSTQSRDCWNSGNPAPILRGTFTPIPHLRLDHT
jgi:hypothetical protein